MSIEAREGRRLTQQSRGYSKPCVQTLRVIVFRWPGGLYHEAKFHMLVMPQLVAAGFLAGNPKRDQACVRSFVSSNA